MTRLILSWSGGKDSALALQALRQSNEYLVEGLLTTFTEGYERVSMHGVRREIIRAQAGAVGVALIEIDLARSATNDEYETAVRAVMLEAEARGVRQIAFGDLHLQDVRDQRERTFAGIGIQPVFPLWGRDTGRLAREFIDSGFEAVLVCVDSQQLDASFVGLDYDHDLLGDLPDDVDPCGEYGEFHTLVRDGPGFTWPVPIRKGEIVLRDGRFWYCDFDLPSDVAGPGDPAAT